MSAFKTASKKKLRFASQRGGLLSTEDLWDLSLDSLDRMAVELNEKLTGQKSFIGRSRKNVLDQLRFDVVKEVIETKLEENAKARTAAARNAELAFLKELERRKQTEELEGLSLEEIQTRVKALEAGDTEAEESEE